MTHYVSKMAIVVYGINRNIVGAQEFTTLT